MKMNFQKTYGHLKTVSFSCLIQTQPKSRVNNSQVLRFSGIWQPFIFICFSYKMQKRFIEV